MMIPEDAAARLARAKSYPFGHPADSYLFRRSGPAPLDDVKSAVAGRTPVLASGSNAAPDQLARKFAAFEPGATIPVTRARLCDFDSVYNAHIAAYGSVPATLHPSPGTVLNTFITWLDEAELAVMHATEQPGINYHFAELTGIEVDVPGLGPLDAAHAYISVAGCLVHEGGPIGLAEVPADNRIFPARTQEQMLELARDLTAPGLPLDDFILEMVADSSLRDARAAVLARTALAFPHPGFRVIETESTS